MTESATVAFADVAVAIAGAGARIVAVMNQ